MRRTSSELVGLTVWTGCGDELGRVVKVRRWPDGSASELVIQQTDGSRYWFVDVEHVKAVSDHVTLKGPREGFHVVPLPAETPQEPSTRAAQTAPKAATPDHAPRSPHATPEGATGSRATPGPVLTITQ